MKKYRKGKNRDFAPLGIYVGYTQNLDNWDNIFEKSNFEKMMEKKELEEKKAKRKKTKNKC